MPKVKAYKPRASTYVNVIGRQPKFGPDGEYLGVQWQSKRVGFKETELIRKWQASLTPEELRLEEEWQAQQAGGE